MLERIKEFFLGDASIAIDADGEPTQADIQIATGVLLMKIAASDQEIAQEEIVSMTASLQRQFDIPEDQLQGLVEISDTLNWQSEKVDEFVALINSKFDEQQRRLIFAMIWTVVLADGKVDAFEKHAADELAGLLELDEKTVSRAKDMARNGEV